MIDFYLFTLYNYIGDLNVRQRRYSKLQKLY